MINLLDILNWLFLGSAILFVCYLIKRFYVRIQRIRFFNRVAKKPKLEPYVHKASEEKVLTLHTCIATGEDTTELVSRYWAIRTKHQSLVNTLTLIRDPDAEVGNATAYRPTPATKFGLEKKTAQYLDECHLIKKQIEEEKAKFASSSRDLLKEVDDFLNQENEGDND